MKKLINSQTETYTTDRAAVTVWKNTIVNDEGKLDFEIRYEFHNVATNEIGTGDLGPDAVSYVMGQEYQDIVSKRVSNLAEYVYNILI